MTAEHHVNIQILNESTVISDADAARCVEALQLQCDEDYTPSYGLSVQLTLEPKGTPPNPRVWQLIILDDSNQAGALGYHEVTINDDPIGFVFAKTTQDFGMSWTVTASHELLEMLGNPGINDSKERDNADGSTTFHFKELCDACEDDSLGYLKTLADGTTVLLSDFVLPRYWDAAAPTGTKFDFCGHITEPFQLLPNGYLSVLEVPSAVQWQQVTADKATGKQVPGGKDPVPFNRRSRHLLPRSQWRKSER